MVFSRVGSTPSTAMKRKESPAAVRSAGLTSVLRMPIAHSPPGKATGPKPVPKSPLNGVIVPPEKNAFMHERTLPVLELVKMNAPSWVAIASDDEPQRAPRKYASKEASVPEPTSRRQT